MSSISCRDVPSCSCRASVMYLLWYNAVTCRPFPAMTYRPFAAVPQSCICCMTSCRDKSSIPCRDMLSIPCRDMSSILCRDILPWHVVHSLPWHVVHSLAWRTVLSPMVRTVQGRWVVCPMTAVMLSEDPSISNSGLTLLKLAVFRKCWNTPAMRKTNGKIRNYQEKRIIFLKKVKEMQLFSNY